MYPPPIAGGLERQGHELAKQLNGMPGVTVRALSGRFDPSQPWVSIAEGIQVTRIRWSCNRAWRYLVAPIDLLLVVWRKRPSIDVVHVHNFSPFGLLAIVAFRLAGKPVLTKMPNIGIAGVPGLRSAPFGRVRILAWRASSAFVAMSRVSLDELLAAGIPRRRIFVVPNGIVPCRDDAARTRSSETAHAVCRVVCVARLGPEKQISTLLHAWKAVVGALGTSAVLEIWGDGPSRAGLQSLANELGLVQRVIWRGHVANVREQLGTVDIFVLPSLIEGNSNAILEAMDAGLPVIATNVGGTSMQVGPAGADLLFAPGDIDGLVARLVMLISDPAERVRRGRLMRDRIRDHFDIRLIAKQYLRAYRALVGKPDPDLRPFGGLPRDC